MDHVWSLLLLLGPWMGHRYTVIHVVYWVELPEQRRLCPIFCEIMGPDKWDTTIWYRVIRNPQEFCWLTVSQWTPEFWGVTASYQSLGIRVPRAWWAWV